MHYAVTRVTYYQDKIKTNKGFLSFEKDTEIEIEPKQDMSRGEMVGGFNFGSTIVLMFEAPKSFEFNLKGKRNLKFYCFSFLCSCFHVCDIITLVYRGSYKRNSNVILPPQNV